MKKVTFQLIFLVVISSISFAQTTPVDSAILRIDKNVTAIQKEISKEKSEKFKGQSIFEDRNGESAIFIPSGGVVRLNTADASLKFSLANRISTKKLFYGINISGKASNGLLSLISKGDISPGAKIGTVIGIQELFHDSNELDGWLALNLGYEGTSFKTFNQNNVFSDQIKKESFNSFNASLSFNMKFGGSKLLAISLGSGKSSNYKDLEDASIIEKRVFVDDSTSTERIFESKINAKRGNYKTFNQVPINLDYLWFPKVSRIGVHHFVRVKYKEESFKTGVGSGLYLLKKDNPLATIGGIVFEVNDLNKLNEGFGKNYTISFVTAINFDFAK